MSKPFGQMMLNNQGTGQIATNAALQSFFKGIYITTENSTLASGEGDIVHFKMGESKILIYYHNADTTGLHFDLGLGSVARVNHFAHDYSTASTQLQAQLNNTALMDTTMFLQGTAGVRTKITFPHLMSWIDSGAIGVNKAELVIRVNKYSAYEPDTFSYPPNLIIFGINTDGSSFVIPDALEGSNYFGGGYNSTYREYRFNIARYIQQVLNRERVNNGIYLIVSNGAVMANRVVIGGGDAASLTRMKLNITYTKLH